MRRFCIPSHAPRASSYIPTPWPRRFPRRPRPLLPVSKCRYWHRTRPSQEFFQRGTTRARAQSLSDLCLSSSCVKSSGSPRIDPHLYPSVLTGMYTALHSCPLNTMQGWVAWDSMQRPRRDRHVLHHTHRVVNRDIFLYIENSDLQALLRARSGKEDPPVSLPYPWWFARRIMKSKISVRVSLSVS